MRKFYTKDNKKQALFELSLGKAPMEVLENIGFDIENSMIKDKKYALKLTNKWKHEVFLNKSLIKNINKEYNSVIFKDEERLKEFDFIVHDYYLKLKEQRKEETESMSDF